MKQLILLPMALLVLSLPGCGDDPEVWVEKACEECDATVYVDEPDVTYEAPPWIDQVDSLRACVPNNDGRIDYEEMPVFLGAAVSYRVNAPGEGVELDVSGKDWAGKWTWDFRGIPDTYPVNVTVEDPAEFWFADEFPEAESVSPVSLWDKNLLGVYRHSKGTTELLGVASRSREGAVYTLIRYDEPVRLFEFPIEVGSKWSQKVSFSNAVVMGVQNAGSETYSFVVDGRGTVLLPDFTLENTLRIRLQLKQTFVVAQGKPTTDYIWYMYVHECLGEVARAVSGPDELEKEFTRAAEFRHLGL